MKSNWKKLLFLFMLPLSLISCETVTTEIESEFPSEFYLLNKDCFGRYFYQNDIAGQVEYELYCKEGYTIEMTESVDSVVLKDELGDITVLSKTDFYNGFGKPIAVSRVKHSDLKFEINSLNSFEDSSSIDEGMKLGKYQFSIKTNNQDLFNRVFRCNRIVSFDSSNIQVYTPVTHPNVFFIDGINSCLVMEMGYFDERGDFAGWERFSADIKSIKKFD